MPVADNADELQAIADAYRGRTPEAVVIRMGEDRRHPGLYQVFTMGQVLFASQQDPVHRGTWPIVATESTYADVDHPGLYRVDGLTP